MIGVVWMISRQRNKDCSTSARENQASHYCCPSYIWASIKSPELKESLQTKRRVSFTKKFWKILINKERKRHFIQERLHKVIHKRNASRSFDLKGNLIVDLEKRRPPLASPAVGWRLVVSQDVLTPTMEAVEASYAFDIKVVSCWYAVHPVQKQIHIYMNIHAQRQ